MNTSSSLPSQMVPLRFTKMHGIGNDYIYLNCLESAPADPAELSRVLSPHHFAVGSDGLVLILPSNSSSDFQMRMFNSDGSEAEMCGNAIRCVGKYLFDRGHTTKQSLAIDTLAGVKFLNLNVADGVVKSVRVDMGAVITDPALIPVVVPQSSGQANGPVVDLPITVPVESTFATKGTPLVMNGTVVSVGNPHVVFFVDKVTDEHILKLGPVIEKLPLFPKKINVEFVEVLSPISLRMRVWERGSGETLACGTGATAVLAAAVLSGRAERKATVHLVGGELEIEWIGDRLFMTGPATFAFDGVADVDPRLL